MKKELIKGLIEYTKGVSCSKRSYNLVNCEKECLLKNIYYEPDNYKKKLCSLITGFGDINEFEKYLEKITKLFIDGGCER